MYSSSKRVADTAVKALCLMFLIAGCCSLPANVPQQRPRASNNTSELFAYPAEQSTIESKQNARNRTPIYIPKRCAENEILYPGDHENDWVCDCKPTFIYHPDTQKCYQMWTQGYCESNRTVLYLEPNEKTPKCIPNPCEENKVLFNNICVTLNQEHEICHVAEIRLVVGINEQTNQLECVNISDVKLKHSQLNLTMTP
uniref:DUF4789 domain-containing protein n=1 Tax=Anopheles farauti TaxID=69004 RepID=A0A182QSI3_9DIPT